MNYKCEICQLKLQNDLKDSVYLSLAVIGERLCEGMQ